MKMPCEDVLNAILTDLVADQVIRALQLGYGRKEVEAAVARGVSHGVYEFGERQREAQETEQVIGAISPRRQNHESK